MVTIFALLTQNVPTKASISEAALIDLQISNAVIRFAESNSIAAACNGEIVGVAADGYRLVSNNGEHGNQEVPHLHVHIFGGRQIRGRMIRPDE